jgi:hypothetical protein
MMTIEPENGRQPSTDRRDSPTGPWDAFRLKGRRVKHRRTREERQNYFVDRFTWPLFALIMLLLISTIADGVITLHLVGPDYQEINPFMGYLLDKGIVPFLLGKYVLTAAGLPFLLIYKNHGLFRTRFRVGYLIPIFVLLYGILLSYQVWLIDALH